MHLKSMTFISLYRKTPLKLPWATKTLKPIISKTKKDILIR
jgi:hypothetical protein